MCCLKYEHPLYQEFNAKAPAAGTQVETPAGDGVVVGHNVPSDTVVVRLAASGRRCACSRADVCSPRQQYEASSTTTPDAPPVIEEPVRTEVTKTEVAEAEVAKTEAAEPEDVVPAEPESPEERRRRKPRRRRRLHHDDEGDTSQ
jgi:cell fate regulator YaaT (PSP1 superfamily)